MDVGEDLPVAPDEDRVAGHAHIELEIASRLTVRILHAKRKHRQPLRDERPCVAHPDDPPGGGRRKRAVVAGQRTVAPGGPDDVVTVSDTPVLCTRSPNNS